MLNLIELNKILSHFFLFCITKQMNKEKEFILPLWYKNVNNGKISTITKDDKDTYNRIYKKKELPHIFIKWKVEVRCSYRQSPFIFGVVYLMEKSSSSPVASIFILNVHKLIFFLFSAIDPLFLCLPFYA